MDSQTATTKHEVIDRLGLFPVINASGNASRLGGARLKPEVIDAMTAASRSFIPIDELQARASELIARVTGAEAGCIATGAAACMFLGAAACMTGPDVAAMDRLPDVSGLRFEIAVHRAHRNAFDHAIRATGARFVEFGYLQPGAPTRVWELESVVGPRTACVFYPALPAAGVLSLGVVCEVAHRHGIPVLVDGSPGIPPAENLRRLFDSGADLVSFSGGKAIGGPGGSGFLAGRRDLVMSATLQQQDMHVWADNWAGPFGEPVPAIYPEPPHQGMGRMLKVGREQVIGLMVALEMYAEADHRLEEAAWLEIAREVEAGLRGASRAAVRIVEPPIARTAQAWIKVGNGTASEALVAATELRRGEPRVFCNETRMEFGELVINPLSIELDEIEGLVARLRAVLT